MLINTYTCPDCDGTGNNSKIENPIVELGNKKTVPMFDSRCMGCGGTGTLTEIEAIRRKMIPNPLFA